MRIRTSSRADTSCNQLGNLGAIAGEGFTRQRTQLANDVVDGGHGVTAARCEQQDVLQLSVPLGKAE